MLGMPPRKGWGAVRLHTSGTPSKDRLGRTPLSVVSPFLIRVDLVRLSNVPVGEAGPQVTKTKTKVYKKIFQHPTSSEEVVRPLPDLLTVDVRLTYLSPR